MVSRTAVGRIWTRETSLGRTGDLIIDTRVANVNGNVVVQIPTSFFVMLAILISLGSCLVHESIDH